MENDTRSSRVKTVTPVSGDRSGSSSSTSRSQRVAPSMRTGTSSRVRSVDMSSVETPVRQPRTAQETRRTPASQTRRNSSSSAAAARRRSSSSSASSTRASAARSSVSARSSASSASSGSRSTTAGNKNYTDILAERRSQSAQSETSTTRQNRTTGVKKKSSSKKGFAGLSRFKKFLIVYAAILVVVIIVVAIVLASYLARFEAGQPTHVAESVVEQFSSTDKLKSFLSKNADIVKSNESILDFEDYYYSFVDGKEISYIADSVKTTSDLSVYKIATDDKFQVAEIQLTKTGSDSWELTSIDTSSAFANVKSYSILAPDNAKITVNGIELTENSITSRGIPEILEYSSQFISSKPEFTTYTVKLASGGVPTVTGTDASGNKIDFTQTDRIFVANGSASQEFIDSVKDRAEKGLEEYALYFKYLAHDLEQYILDDCELHKFIFGSEDFDPINPWLYNWDYINTYEFRSFSVENYTLYADDCFTVDVKYDLHITFNRESTMGYQPQDIPDDDETMDATWVWVKEKGGDGIWYLADSIVH